MPDRQTHSKPNVAIVGGAGVIGTVLQKGLKKYKITSLDLPTVDAKKYKDLLKHFKGQDAVIHLALSDSDNSTIAYNVYQAALETKVKRVIMASSVHADNFYTWKSKKKLSVDRIPKPTTQYGIGKIFMEALGRYYASYGLEVVCIRFGGVNQADKPPENNFWENAVWLSHKDCAKIINACLKASTVPHNFAVFYAVSNNKDRVHDTKNPFSWSPI